MQSCHQQRPILRNAGYSEEEGVVSEGAVELLRINPRNNKHMFNLSMQPPGDGPETLAAVTRGPGTEDSAFKEALPLALFEPLHLQHQRLSLQV